MNLVLDPNANEGVVIAELARRAAQALVEPQQGKYKDACPYLVLRDADGKERVEWLHERMADPTRKYGTVKMHDAKSFLEVFNLHKGDGADAVKANIYGALSPAQFIAVLNDHNERTPGWRDHRIIFTCAHSPEWLLWEKHDRQPFNGNDAFAYFIEETAPDFDKPDASAMLAMALNFRVKQGVQFDSAVRLDNGDVDLVYRNKVEAAAQSNVGGKLKIPEQFTLKLRVWDGPDAKVYKLDARFRYRLSDGSLKLWYELVRPKRVIESAFKDLWADIEKGTGAKVLYGSPE